MTNDELEVLDSLTPDEVDIMTAIVAARDKQAAEIRRLRSENARLREALLPFAECWQASFGPDERLIDCREDDYTPTLGDCRRACEAINDSPGRSGASNDP